MSVIVRGDWSPPATATYKATFGSYGALGDPHPAIPSYVSVDWEDGKSNGYFPRRNLIVVGTGFLGKETHEH